jgi:hypothetical protein
MSSRSSPIERRPWHVFLVHDGVRSGAHAAAHQRDTSAADLTPVTNFQYKDRQSLPIRSIDHSVITDANAILVLRSLQFPRARREGVSSEFIDVSGEPALYRSIESFELAHRRTGELDGVGHSAPLESHLFLDFRPRNPRLVQTAASVFKVDAILKLFQ